MTGISRVEQQAAPAHGPHLHRTAAPGRRNPLLQCRELGHRQAFLLLRRDLGSFAFASTTRARTRFAREHAQRRLSPPGRQRLGYSTARSQYRGKTPPVNGFRWAMHGSERGPLIIFPPQAGRPPRSPGWPVQPGNQRFAGPLIGPGRCPLYVRAQLDTVGLSWTPWDLVWPKAIAREAGKIQLTGYFRRWWHVLGSNQRRLSRRFYRMPIPTHRNGR